MRFIFTPHILLRLKQRTIPVSDVKWVVKNDGKTKINLTGKVRVVSLGVTKTGRKLKVVYEIPANNSVKSKVIIITSLWK